MKSLAIADASPLAPPILVPPLFAGTIAVDAF